MWGLSQPAPGYQSQETTQSQQAVPCSSLTLHFIYGSSASIFQAFEIPVFPQGSKFREINVAALYFTIQTTLGFFPIKLQGSGSSPNT